MLYALWGSVHADSAQEFTVRAGLALNFARFTEWPDTVLKDIDTTINLCLLGNPMVEEAFASIHGKTVGNRTLQVQLLAHSSNLNDCHILYVSDLDKNKIAVLLDEIVNLPILTIGEDDFFIQRGGAVSLEILNDKISIKINLKTAKQNGLTISARVLKLATVIQ